MNEWFEKIKATGFEADIFFTKDGNKTIILQKKSRGSLHVKNFFDIDADRCLDSALQYAQNYDAYVETMAACHVS